MIELPDPLKYQNKMPFKKLSMVKIEKRKEMDRYRVGLNVAMSEFIY